MKDHYQVLGLARSNDTHQSDIERAKCYWDSRKGYWEFWEKFALRTQVEIPDHLGEDEVPTQILGAKTLAIYALWERNREVQKRKQILDSGLALIDVESSRKREQVLESYIVLINPKSRFEYDMQFYFTYGLRPEKNPDGSFKKKNYYEILGVSKDVSNMDIGLKGVNMAMAFQPLSFMGGGFYSYEDHSQDCAQYFTISYIRDVLCDKANNIGEISATLPPNLLEYIDHYKGLGADNGIERILSSLS